METTKLKDITQDCFDVILNKYSKTLYKYCFHMLRNSSEAEDAVQEIFIKYYRQYTGKETNEYIKSYLYKMAHNHCVNILRRKNILRFITLDNEEALQIKTEDNYYGSELSEEIEAALSKLSSEQRTVIILRTIEEMSYEEIATIINKTPAATRKQFERGRKRIKAFIELKKGEDCNETFNII